MKGGRTIVYLALLTAQAVICNFLDFGPWVVLSFLPSMVLALDLRLSPIHGMGIALIFGLVLDFFTTGVLGLSAIPLVALAFCREWLAGLVFGSEVLARREELSERKQGAPKIIICLLLANLLFFAIFVWIDAAGSRSFGFCSLRALLSTLVSTLAGFFVLRLINSVEETKWK